MPSWTKRSCAAILKGRTAIGTRLLVNAMVQPPQAVLREIVGVVKHVKERPEEPEAPPQIYVPIAQNTWWLASLVVQPASGPAAAIAPAVRAALARVEPDRPRAVPDARPGFRRKPRRGPASGPCSSARSPLLALTLALVGVFGVLAYSVQQRTREFGVRIALGASAASVLRLVDLERRRGDRQWCRDRSRRRGAVVSRSISAFLFGVQPLDPVTFVLVPLVLSRDRRDRRRRAGLARGARRSGGGISI